MVGIVGSGKYNAIVISVWNFGWNTFVKLKSMICCGCFLSSKCSFSFFSQFSLLFVTILTISFANDSNILFFAIFQSSV